eukprot:226267-Rhodomonas_salina.1
MLPTVAAQRTGALEGLQVTAPLRCARCSPAFQQLLICRLPFLSKDADSSCESHSCVRWLALWWRVTSVPGRALGVARLVFPGRSGTIGRTETANY